MEVPHRHAGRCLNIAAGATVTAKGGRKGGGEGCRVMRNDAVGEDTGASPQ